VERVRADRAVGRSAAEQITRYPPGIPAVVPGERLTDTVIGLGEGMNVLDPADTSLSTFRVVAP
jgi:arginine/lysine/ornithine decarboxylase